MRIINLTLMILAVSAQVNLAQRYTDKITKEFSFKEKNLNNAILVSNINGAISVMGYAGDQVIVEIERTVTAKSTTLLEKGKTEIQLGVIDKTDSLIFYVAGTCHKFGKSNKNHAEWEYDYSWNNCNGQGCREDFDYKMNFILKVPFASHILIHTINDGDLIVENVNGKVKANNINGNIKLTHLTQAAVASTINGNLDIEYDQNPETDCRFYSLNGNINANFQKGLAAKLSFESFNGSFYTNINQIEALPSVLEKSEASQGIKYKVKGSKYKLGKGGALLDFETFNGNVYLKERTN